MKRKQIVVEVVCFLLIVLFMYAAVSKLTEYQKFRIQIAQSPMLTSFAGVIAWLIPTVEIAICILLAFNRSRLAGLYASFGLMVAFTAYIIAITQFSEFIPCSCGGVLQNLGWTEHLIFNSGFAAIAAIGCLLFTSPESSQTDTLLSNT